MNPGQHDEEGSIGDQSQKFFSKKFFERYSIQGPIAEIGAKLHNGPSGVDHRSNFPDCDYHGIDIEHGPGVDIVDDMACPRNLKPEFYGYSICCSMLEHVPRPWVVAENISKILKRGGFLYLSVPWVWPYHQYPDDYFRFSFSAVEVLFDDFDILERWYGNRNEAVEVKEESHKFLDRNLMEKYSPSRVQLHVLAKKKTS